MRTAAYARYSSDQQRDASLDDQLRNIRAHCTRMGWSEPAVYTDAAISGSREDRPQYRKLLSDASRFDVLLVDDLSRLSRDSAECTKAIRRMVFAGVRVIGVSDGIDTARKSHTADVGLRGLMSELYLVDLADKTHRGLTGRALAGASAGGLPFGYRVTEVGKRAIDQDQAAIVQRVFDRFVAGDSARTIAAGLNAAGIPAARGSTWCQTAIYGDVRRGIGMLANPIYVGRQVWNRSHWVKHPDSGRRVRQERPESEWIITEHAELRIIEEAVWNAAQARLRASGRRRLAHPTGRPGRAPSHLLSGLLRCGECGGPMVVVDRYRYGCSKHKDRGTCTSRLRVARASVESAMLASVQTELLSESAFKRFEVATRMELKRKTPDISTAVGKVEAAERTLANIMAALRAGIITPSTRVALITAERDVELAKSELAEVRKFQPAQFLPRAREVWRRLVAQLADMRDVPTARDALREIVGQAVLREDSSGVYAEIEGSQISVVAGAGYGRWLTVPIRVPIPRCSRRAV